MSYMKPDYYKGTMLLVDVSVGGYIALEEYATADGHYVFPEDIEDHPALERCTGVFCRLASRKRRGLLSVTHWDGPYCDLQTAERALMNAYNVCPQCGEVLDLNTLPENVAVCPACKKPFISPKKEV